MTSPATADRLRQLNEQHRTYADLFIQFALLIGGLAHQFKDIGVTELRTHGHIRLGFLGHEVYVDYWPCVQGGELVGKLRFSQRVNGADHEPEEYFALYYDSARRVSESPTMSDARWNLLDPAAAWEFLTLGLDAFASQELLPP